MEEKKIVLEFSREEVGFILQCLHIGIFAFDIIKNDLVISRLLDSVRYKLYKEYVKNDKKL